jgi:hypothetical protein
MGIVGLNMFAFKKIKYQKIFGNLLFETIECKSNKFQITLGI